MLLCITSDKSTMRVYDDKIPCHSSDGSQCWQSLCYKQPLEKHQPALNTTQVSRVDTCVHLDRMSRRLLFTIISDKTKLIEISIQGHTCLHYILLVSLCHFREIGKEFLFRHNPIGGEHIS
jgi:hypothetical protein